MVDQLELAFILLVVYQLKHFVCDFPLQRGWMLNKIRPGWDFIPPLSAHAAVHSLASLAIIFVMHKPQLWWLAIVDFAAHFIMDRIKAGPKYLGRFKDKTKAPYWNSLGFDQMVHHLTHLYLVWVLIQ